MTPLVTQAYDVESVRAEFPALAQDVHGKRLAYLDNAATTQKPHAVLDVLDHYYRQDNANVHRGVHELSQRATDQYEGARGKLAKFLGAEHSKEIIWVRGTTEAINLVAAAYGRPNLEKGDEVLITRMEHHSNIVPWQLLCMQTGAEIKVVDVADDGSLDMADFESKLSDRTKVAALSHVSNALGTVNPMKEMAAAAHDVGAVVLADGAQAAPHLPVDVQDLGVDFYALSGHKMYGPTGIGVLYGKADVLEAMPPYQGGGDMIQRVTFEGTTYNELPYKFEAGTPHIAGAIGLGAAADYLMGLGVGAVHAHEDELIRHATDRFHDEIPAGTIIGTAPGKAAVLSFTLDGVHPHDIGSLLDRVGVAVRTGHHCAQPVMDRFEVPATTRASFGCYNTIEEADRFVDGVKQLAEVFA